ncbi:hypothetical protein [Bacillus cihuensis]|uniref:hypothetical protein n=1 Tax=Bacillus cihuensis TaxID=1208599 RepID=UPI00048C5124|nr:hypothetical protein [Bacillus cihuensis]
MFITVFFYVMAPLLVIRIAVWGFSMINGKFVKDVEQILDNSKKFSFFNLPETIGYLIVGIFVVIFHLILPKKTANILVKITYFLIGLLFIIFAVFFLYIIIKEGNSIITDVKNNNL